VNKTVVEHVDDSVVAQRNLFLFAARVLDNRDEVARYSFAFHFDQRVRAESRCVSLDRNEGEVEFLIVEEEGVRVKVEQVVCSGLPSTPS
jgi:hypothetical protein